MENDPRYAQLMSIMQGRPPMIDDNSYGMNNMQPNAPPMQYGDMNQANMPGSSNMPDPSQRASPAAVPGQKSFNPTQLLQLRAQIMAYKLISRNQPLPDHIKMAMLGKQPGKVPLAPGSSPGPMPGNTNQPSPQVPVPGQGVAPNGPGTSPGVAPNQTAYNVPGMSQGTH